MVLVNCRERECMKISLYDVFQSVLRLQGGNPIRSAYRSLLIAGFCLVLAAQHTL